MNVFATTLWDATPCPCTQPGRRRASASRNSTCSSCPLKDCPATERRQLRFVARPSQLAHGIVPVPSDRASDRSSGRPIVSRGEDSIKTLIRPSPLRATYICPLTYTHIYVQSAACRLSLCKRHCYSSRRTVAVIGSELSG